MEALLVVHVGLPIVQKRLCLRLVHDLDRILGLQWMLRQSGCCNDLDEDMPQRTLDTVKT